MIEKATSVDQVKRFAERYALPSGYEGGIDNLIEKGVLEGSPDKFDVPDRLRRPIEAWIQANDSTLQELTAFYRARDERKGPVSEEERALAAKLR